MLFKNARIFSSIILLYLSGKVLVAEAHKCVLNPFYHPICGSDGHTYGNKDILACHNRNRPRSRQIRAIYHRECEPLICPSVHDLRGPWPNTAPVCASNGYTYGHVHQVRCLSGHIPGLRVLHEGGCSMLETYRALGQNAQNKACVEPRRLFEMNPVCNHRNQTYANPFAAICQLGARFSEKAGGVCGCPMQRSCERLQKLQRSLSAAAISEWTKYLVCGSDLRTYRSEHNLECSRRYNRYLYLTHYGRCEDFSKICPEKLKHIQVPSPVCASDNHSYTSFEALICARFRMNKNLHYVHSGACVK